MQYRFPLCGSFHRRLTVGRIDERLAPAVEGGANSASLGVVSSSCEKHTRMSFFLTLPCRSFSTKMNCCASGRPTGWPARDCDFNSHWLMATVWFRAPHGGVTSYKPTNVEGQVKGSYRATSASSGEGVPNTPAFRTQSPTANPLYPERASLMPAFIPSTTQMLSLPCFRWSFADFRTWFSGSRAIGLLGASSYSAGSCAWTHLLLWPPSRSRYSAHWRIQ